MSVVQDWLAGGPLLTDGAWGTELQDRGLDTGSCPDAWNLIRPDDVETVGRAYVEAGSRVILTNTFRANPIALEGYGLAADCDQINRAGVALSRKAAGTQAMVFASIGPSGKMLAAGDIDTETLERSFASQTASLAAAGPDALLLETFSDLEEAQIALRAALPFGLPVIVSFVFDSGRNKDRTMMGNTPEQVAQAMQASGASAMGANCGAGIAAFVSICARLKLATSLPLWIKANAGLPEIVDGEVVYRTSPDEFASHIPALLEAGAGFVGGCCGTSPAFIRAAAGTRTLCAGN